MILMIQGLAGLGGHRWHRLTQILLSVKIRVSPLGEPEGAVIRVPQPQSHISQSQITKKFKHK